MTPYASIIVMTLIAGGVAVWIGVARRMLRRELVVPWELRRVVPWQGGHVLTLILLYAGLQICMPVLLTYRGERREGAVRQSEQLDTEHLVGRLLRDSHKPLVVLVCLASAGLAAPFSEEFLFRLVLQGWLEKKDRLFRRRWGFKRLTPGLVPVFLVAVLFAGIHYRGASPQVDVWVGARILLGSVLASVVTLVVGVVWLRLDVGATAADLGFVRRKWAADVRLGLLAYLAISTVLFPSQVVLSRLLPPSIAPDPFALFPFAWLLGFLYYRTHRLIPSIVVHAGLNGTSLLVAWLHATFSS